jgi:C1A family cysteine protease
MKSIAVIAALLGMTAVVSAAAPLDLTTEQSEWLFNAWRKQHNKEYASAEEAVHRFGIFQENVKWIHDTNSKGLSYSVGINQFADLTNAEWREKLLATRVPEEAKVKKPHGHHRHTAKPVKAGPTPPTSWDWRQHGGVNPIQNQGQCGSCWAFTAGDAISGIWAIKTGISIFPVSVQEIVDCSGSQGNQGCNGGWPSAAFQWVIANGGICDWSEYSYTAETGTCASTNCTNVARISGLVSIAQGDEAALMPATWAQPVSIAVNAATQSYQFYTGGVLDDPTCDPTQIDHGETLIGWGHDAASGKDYWQVRNMWGTSWGEQGYIRIVRGKNMCGVAEAAAYPTLNL